VWQNFRVRLQRLDFLGQELFKQDIFLIGTTMIFRKYGIVITTVCLSLITVGLASYKVFFLGYTFSSIIPQVEYNVDILMSFQAFGEPITVKTYLPISDSRQTIGKEVNNSGRLSYELITEERGRVGGWSGEDIKGKQQIIYSFSAQAEHIVYQIQEDLTIPELYSEGFREHLSSTSVIQVNHPVISEIYRETVPQTKNIAEILRAIFDYVYSLKPMPFKGLTDAVTAARLEEASCNGKSRLFVALARRANIPSRLVGGLILESGTKRTSHQWVEGYINGYWVPFDALNNHFAEIPENYLTLYYGDEVLFKHSPDINFDYTFKIRKHLTSHTGFMTELGAHPLNAYNVWTAFSQIGIPISLLKIIIMLPLGAFIVVIFRNVIGLETFGTFLPALIACASRETGFLWGIIGFILIIALVSLIHYPLEQWGVLHTPKMSILLVCVVMAMLSLTVIGVKMKLFDLSYVSLFPIAVLTITAERFALLQIEEGFKKALRVMFMTVIVVGFCYLMMNSLAMQALFLAFPELFLILIVLNLWLGRWIGVRLTEFRRFRWLIERE